MKLVTLRTAEGTRAGRVDGDEIVELDHADVGALLEAGHDWRDRAAAADGRRHAHAEADLAPVVVRPGKIICLGLNYEKHILEMGRELPTYPTLFAKYTEALIGPYDAIQLPPESTEIDWEVELALVVGRAGRRIPEDWAMEHIAGYTVMNDVSMRDFQWRSQQFLQGKTWERSTPIGPALVTLDEVENPDDLVVRCEVDGEVMQEAQTGDLLFGPTELISYISTILTLRPGDIIATGTPGGVGAGRKPAVFLHPGQVVRTIVEGVGELRNECVAERVD